MQYILSPQYLIHGWFIYEIFLFQGAKDICLVASQTTMKARTTMDQKTVSLVKLLYITPFFDPLHSITRCLIPCTNGIYREFFSVHNWTTEYQKQVLPPVWQWISEMTSEMSLLRWTLSRKRWWRTPLARLWWRQNGQSSLATSVRSASTQRFVCFKRNHWTSC